MRLKEIRTEKGLSVPKLVELSGVPRRTIQDLEAPGDGRVSTAIKLADALGVTRQTIISLENGKYNASLQLAHKIAVYFHMNIEEIFLFEEE